MEKIAALEDAIQKKNLTGIYSVFYTIAHGDPGFFTGKFMDTLAYVKSKNIDGLMQEFDDDELKGESEWDEDYWAYIASSLMDNFCETRIEHLKQIGQKVYPAREKTAASVAGIPGQPGQTVVGNIRRAGVSPAAGKSAGASSAYAGSAGAASSAYAGSGESTPLSGRSAGIRSGARISPERKQAVRDSNHRKREERERGGGVHMMDKIDKIFNKILGEDR